MSDTLRILQEIPDLANVPADQLQWLVDHGKIETFEPGGKLFSPGQMSQYMFIMLEGRIRMWFDQNGSSREVGRLEKGDITGVLPYSRLKEVRAHGSVLETSRVLVVDKKVFPEMIRTQYELVEALVHFMNNRIRNFTTLQVQNEKLMALGKLSAGLAHELNNPSSAVVRVAKDLKEHLGYIPERFKRIIAIRLTNEQVDRVNEHVYEKIQRGVQSYSMLERNRREGDMEDWLDDHHINVGPDVIEGLVDYGFDEDSMDFILDQVSETELEPVLSWVGNVLTTEKYVDEIHDASKRINDLVTSIKSYSHMDQDQDRGAIDVREGIRSTKRMLEHKFRKAKASFDEDFEDPLPLIHANPGELNQVWTNIIDNALDALEEHGGGVVTVRAFTDGPCLKVIIMDNGPGIPSEVASRVFDPFFTTKKMGKGTGMGLEVVQRIVQAHRGNIELHSEPGKTEFIIWFPLD